jgi:hypothetical protein
LMLWGIRLSACVLGSSVHFPDKKYLPCLYRFSRNALINMCSNPMRKKCWPSILSLSETIRIQASSVNICPLNLLRPLKTHL